MKWGNVKWILILLLVVADAYLGIQLIRQYRGAYTVDRTAVENAAELLSDAGLLLDPSVIPEAVEREYVYRIPVSSAGFEAALAGIAGSPVTGTYLQPSSSGVSLVFENGDSAEYFQNLYFTYTRRGKEETEEEENARLAETAKRFLDGADGFSPVGGAKAREAEKAAAAVLDAMTGAGGAGVSGVRLQPRTGRVCRTEDGSLFLIVFREELSRAGSRGGTVIGGTQVCALVENGIVRYLEGTWVPFLPDEVYGTGKLDQLNILFSEMRRKEGSVSAGAPQRITEMERVSYMLWETGTVLWLRPAWQITYAEENGDSRFVTLCDAVTGGVVSEIQSSGQR